MKLEGVPEYCFICAYGLDTSKVHSLPVFRVIYHLANNSVAVQYVCSIERGLKISINNRFSERTDYREIHVDDIVDLPRKYYSLLKAQNIIPKNHKQPKKIGKYEIPYETSFVSYGQDIGAIEKIFGVSKWDYGKLIGVLVEGNVQVGVFYDEEDACFSFVVGEDLRENPKCYQWSNWTRDQVVDLFRLHDERNL